jgi:hypothetical protein
MAVLSDKPICVDLYAGLGGWAEGFLAEGWHCRGYDSGGDGCGVGFGSGTGGGGPPMMCLLQ